MAIIKNISPRFLGRIAWLIVRILAKTLRIEKNDDDIERYSTDEPVIYTLWHGRMFIPMYCFAGLGAYVLVSEHRDGDIITAALESAGYRTVRGSTTRGGVKALAGLIRLVKHNGHVGFTPDGPRGPRWRFQPGAVYVAAKTGAPLVPVAGSARRAYYFKSWDRFQLPLPFSGGIVIVGEPYYVTGGMDEANIEFHRAEMERRMTALIREADERMGVSEP